MDTSQTIEPSGGEPTSPPPLPGRRDEREKSNAEIFIELMEARLDRLGGDMIYAGCKNQGTALMLEATLLVGLARSLKLIPESGEAKRRSDPGNVQAHGTAGGGNQIQTH